MITEDGWFRTGDMGKVDAEGFVFVEDRLKDMIISGGENIYSPEVERVLAEHPAVAECAIIGVPDDTWGETVKAVVALKPDTSATEDELIEYCREHLAHFKCPKSVDIIEALPRNPTGKILKKDLRKPYWEGRDRSVKRAEASVSERASGGRRGARSARVSRRGEPMLALSRRPGATSSLHSPGLVTGAARLPRPAPLARLAGARSRSLAQYRNRQYAATAHSRCQTP